MAFRPAALRAGRIGAEAGNGRRLVWVEADLMGHRRADRLQGAPNRGRRAASTSMKPSGAASAAAAQVCRTWAIQVAGQDRHCPALINPSSAAGTHERRRARV